MASEHTHLLQEITILRKRVAELEAANESMAMSVINALPVPVLLKDANLRWRWGNDALCNLLRLERDSLGGLTDDYVHKKKDAREINRCDRAVLSSGEPASYEKNLTIGNATYHLSVLKTRWNAPGTGEPHVLSIVRDVTAVRMAEKTAQESRDRFSQIMHNTPMGIHMFSLDENETLIFTDANPAADRLTGQTSALQLGKPALEVFPSMQILGLEEAFSSVARTGKPWTGHEIPCPDNPELLFDIYAFHIPPNNVAVQFEDVSNTVEAHRQVEISENRYRSLFESSPIPMWELDYSKIKHRLDQLRENGVAALEPYLRNNEDELYNLACSIRVLGMNSACVQMMEATSAKQVADGIVDMFGNKERLATLEPLLTLEKGLPVESFTIKGRTVLGNERTFRVHTSVMPGHEKKLSRVLVTTVDETEQLRTKKAVTESEERLRLVLAATKDGVWDWDLTTGKAYFSPTYYTMLGYRPDEFESSAQSWGNLLHPDDRDKTMEKVRKSFEQSNELSVEFRMQSKTGRWVWILCRARVVERDDQGRPLRTVGSNTDITALKKVQEQSLEYKNLFESMADNLIDMLWAKDMDGNYLFANKSLRNNLLHSNNEFVAGHNDAFFDERLRRMGKNYSFSQSCIESDETVLRTRLPGRSEEQYEIDGIPTIFDIRKSPLYDRQGELIGTVGMGRDITEGKRIQDDLIQAKEAAESAARSKDQFLANMSHEIRTPMNGVLGMLQLLDATPLTQEQTEYVETALESGRGLLSVINDILDFSKMQSSVFSLSEQEFSLRETMRTVLRSFSVQARDKRISLSYELASNLPQTMIGDDARLRQILFNLVGNAVKFTHSGGVCVRADRLVQQGEKILLGLEVSDTGIGIPDSLLNKVFDPFTQADSSFSRMYQGTGLGLGIVRALAERMGGTVSIDSEPDKGSTIYVTVQLGLPHSERMASETDSAVHSSEQSLRVLIVEDDAVNRFTIRRYLEKNGYAVIEANSGEEAVHLCSDQHFDCVLMDIQMPTMDGLTATRKIRETDQGKTIPIVALTAHAMQGDRERFLAAGMNGYVSKPLELDELTDAVNAVITKDVPR